MLHFNTVVLSGRLTKDPVLRKTANGKSVVSFTVAVSKRFRQEGQADADFVSCVAWDNAADYISKYGKKGSSIGIEGRIQTRSYDDQTGKKVYVTEVVAEEVQVRNTQKQQEVEEKETDEEFPF